MRNPNAIFFLSWFTYGTATAIQYIIDVSDANNSLTFAPDNINALSGDTVEFRFLAGNHSVVQSDFYAPCEPLSDGINSGFWPVIPEDVSGPLFRQGVVLIFFSRRLKLETSQVSWCKYKISPFRFISTVRKRTTVKMAWLQQSILLRQPSKYTKLKLPAAR